MVVFIFEVFFLQRLIKMSPYLFICNIFRYYSDSQETNINSMLQYSTLSCPAQRTNDDTIEDEGLLIESSNVSNPRIDLLKNTNVQVCRFFKTSQISLEVTKKDCTLDLRHDGWCVWWPFNILG